MDFEKVLEVVKKHITVDKKGLSKDMAILIILPFLKKIVSDTENKFDDKAYSYVEEWVEKNL
jgi:hypothetical protein